MWGDVYDDVWEKGYDVLGGASRSVSAAGGWLMGGGLSAFSRSRGMGIDNVLSFELVTISASLTIYKQCSVYCRQNLNRLSMMIDHVTTTKKYVPCRFPREHDVIWYAISQLQHRI